MIKKVSMQRLVCFFGLLMFIFIVTTKVRAQTQTEDVTINASISSCILNLRSYPEKRIPSTNNWQNILEVEMIDENQQLSVGVFTVTTNNQGEANVNLCDQNINVVGGNYTFRLKGYSHLIKQYSNINTFNTQETTIDFTALGNDLLAGETSPVYDNKINSLDISTQINYIFTSDIKNDLNRDGKVNSLDISNTITNFFVIGD